MADLMPTWREWNEEMSEDQRKYSMYKILVSLESRFSERGLVLLALDLRIKRLETRKWIDRGAAFTGGVLGGLLAQLGLKELK